MIVLHPNLCYIDLSYDVASGSEIRPCHKIDKSLVGKVMTLHNMIESNIHAPVLLNLLNSLRKRDKMLGKLHILSLFPQLV